MIEDRKNEGLPGLLKFDPYRHNLTKATSSQDVWHYLMLAAACLFFADVFVRRVQIGFDWLPPLLGRVRDRILRREAKAAPAETIERLRSRKAAISQQIEERRAAARFEPTPDAPAPDLESLSPSGRGRGREKNPQLAKAPALEPANLSLAIHLNRKKKTMITPTAFCERKRSSQGSQG